jgi:hypothetical protein
VGYLLAREGWVPVKTMEARALPEVGFSVRPMVANVRFLKVPGVRTSYHRSSVPVMNTLPSVTQGPIECRSILAQENLSRIGVPLRTSLGFAFRCRLPRPLPGK